MQPQSRFFDVSRSAQAYRLQNSMIPRANLPFTAFGPDCVAFCSCQSSQHQTPPKHRHNAIDFFSSLISRPVRDLTMSLRGLLEGGFLHSKQLLRRQSALLELICFLFASLYFSQPHTLLIHFKLGIAYLQLLLMLISHIQNIRDILPKP